MDEVINLFMSTRVWHELTSDSNTLMIYLGGSRSVGVVDDNSDYDICVISKQKQLFDGSLYHCLSYRGKQLHWYIYDIDSYISTTLHKDSIWTAGWTMVYFTSMHNVLYIQPGYECWAERWLLQCTHVGKLGARMLFERCQREVQTALYDDCPKLYKRHYQLCLAYNVLTDTPCEKEFLNRVKRCKIHPISQSDVNKVQDTISKLKEYIEINPINLHQEVSNLKLLLHPYRNNT